MVTFATRPDTGDRRDAVAYNVQHVRGLRSFTVLVTSPPFLMPHKDIIYTEAHKSLQSPHVVTTALGNALLEIQGELILPGEKPEILTAEEQDNYTQLDGVLWAVKLGKLELEGNKAVLYIGTSQRLLGEVKTVDPPLALLRFPEDSNNDDLIEMVDVIKHKIIFTGRPLPIM